MKTITTSGLSALILTLISVWYLQPLNIGAITLLFLIFLGISSLLVGFLTQRFKSRKSRKSRASKVLPGGVAFATLSAGIIIFGAISITKFHPDARVPAREFLIENEVEDPGYGAFGYLIFSKSPGESEKERYKAVCNAFLQSLQPAFKYHEKHKKNLMVTYWLLTVTPNKEQSKECSYLVENYDYAKASDIASAANIQSAQDIALVAWDAPYISTSKREALVVKLTNFENEDLARAFSIWKSRITTKPEVWNDGIRLVLAVEAFRSLIQKYGDDIVSVFKSST